MIVADRKRKESDGKGFRYLRLNSINGVVRPQNRIAVLINR